MILMKKMEHVGAIVKKRTLVRSKELKGLSVSRSHLWNLAKAGKIERVGRGLYRSKETPISTNQTLLEVAKRVPHGVLCLSSALRYHELTTENPFEVWLAIQRGAWSPKLDYPPVRVVHFSEAAFEFGIETHSVDGGTLRIYSPAKTVADCFKFRSKIGMETAIQALRSAYREKKASMDQLWRAAKVCRVVNVMRPYMESLV
jgi:predicted transcriptional regulator of viral defense system